jgi:hypothetical protein
MKCVKCGKTIAAGQEIEIDLTVADGNDESEHEEAVACSQDCALEYAAERSDAS